MSNYNNLKSAIQSVIKANGNNEITGPILQSELLAMINTLGAGYQYMGVAQPSTNPGTPDARVMYLAYLPGTYVNFGGITVTGFCVLRYDTSWTKEDIPISGGGGGADFLTEPDDLTLQTVGNTQILKFANRAYNSTTPNGLGFKILRNDLTFAQQLTDANTIYEIRYDFDLQTGTVNVPENCILRFNGGSVKNGGLNLSDNVTFEAGYVKIFDGIVFTGKTNNQYFFIDWFVANYAESIDGAEPDATAEIQAMFNSGIKKVWLTNRHHYRVTNTITIDASILVNGTHQTDNYRRENKMIFGNFDAPIITIKPSSLVYGASVQNVYIRRIVDNDSLTSANGYKENIPTILVDCSVSAIWGLYINAVIHANQITASYQTSGGTMKSTTSGVGFTGIEINAVKYCYYVRITGEIRNFYRGVYTHQGSSGLYTGGEYLFDSNCAKGGELVGNARIGGMHELCKVFPGRNNIGYFTTNDDVFIDGYIWDTSFTLAYNANNLFAVTYSVKAKHFRSGPGMQNDIAQYDGGCDEIKTNTVVQLDGNAIMGANILPQAFYGQGIGGYNPGGISNIIFRAFETDADYQEYINGDTTKGIPVDKENTFGFENLFFPDKFYYDTVSGNPQSQNYAMKSYIKDKAIKVLYFECAGSSLRRASLIVFQYSSIITSVVVKRGASEYTFTRSLGYYAPICVAMHDGEKIQVTINYNAATEKADIPFIGICGPAAASLIGPWGGSSFGLVRMNNLQFLGGTYASGKKILTQPSFREFKTDTTGSWIPILHYTVAGNNSIAEINIIINGDRFTVRTWSTYGAIVYGNVLKNNTDFLVYKKSTNNYVICAKNFNNLHIESAECNLASSFAIVDDLDTLDLSTYNTYSMYYAVTKSGVTADRPSVPSGYYGVSYFDTTLGKMIWYNGSNWVDATGTQV